MEFKYDNIWVSMEIVSFARAFEIDGIPLHLYTDCGVQWGECEISKSTLVRRGEAGSQVSC